MSLIDLHLRHRAGSWLAIGTKRLIDDPGVSDAAKITYFKLSSYVNASGWCYPSIARLSAERNQSVRTTQYHLRELVDGGHIRVEVRRGEKGEQRSNRYQIILDAPSPGDDADEPWEEGAEDCTGSGEGAEDCAPPMQEVCTTPVQAGCTQNHIRGTKNEEPYRAGEERKFALPAGWTPEPIGIAFAEKAGVPWQVQLGKFRLYWQGKGSRKRAQDWSAAWRNWIANEHQRMTERGHRTPLPEWATLKAEAKDDWTGCPEVRERTKLLSEAVRREEDDAPLRGSPPLLGFDAGAWTKRDWLKAADEAIRALHARNPRRYPLPSGALI